MSKWSGFQRQCSVPVESRSDAKLKIPRSRSHPGCLNKHAQDSSDVKVGGLKKLLSDAKTKKLARKGYGEFISFTLLSSNDIIKLIGLQCNYNYSHRDYNYTVNVYNFVPLRAQAE